MQANQLKSLLLNYLVHEPTQDQEVLMTKLSEFLTGVGRKQVFLLKGYAGTGKTTSIGALVQLLQKMPYEPVLLAPTGRAAKVLASYTGKQAMTIHKKIYHYKVDANGNGSFALAHNPHQGALFIVDEASMISGSMPFNYQSGQKDLLTDLISYVFHGDRCGLMLIGDTAQLPPVGSLLSPALDPAVLEAKYPLKVETATLRQVVRQEFDSGILVNATAVRHLIDSEEPQLPRLIAHQWPDVEVIDGYQLEDALHHSYQFYGEEETIVVCRSNKRANLFNQQIRNRIKWLEGELSAGDLMMVVKNNYFWLDKDSKAGFIANGDIIEILKVGQFQELFGFKFVDVTIRMVDFQDEPEQEVKLLLDAVHSPGPAITREHYNELYNAVLEDYMDLPTKKDRETKMSQDPYLNALQVKFAYAITCHKAQGGQWDSVFIDQGFMTEERVDLEYLRWMYTAVTRATKKLYLVNFPPEFLGD